MLLIACLAISLIANGLLLNSEIRRRRRKHGASGRSAIRTVAPEEFDPIFNLGEIGPAKETCISFLPEFGVRGGVTDFETWIICALAKKAEAIFEFGTCTGKTTWLMASSAPKARVTTITLNPGTVENYKPDPGDEQIAWDCAIAESHFTTYYYQNTPEAERVVQLFGDSKDLDEQAFAGKFDLIFIDGSHAKSYVESDSKKALKMVRPGGVILWHDYHGPSRAKGVFLAINELAKQIPLVRIADTCLAAYRAPTLI